MGNGEQDLLENINSCSNTTAIVKGASSKKFFFQKFWPKLTNQEPE